ncbi:MAG TPA: AAA family ATPase [Candidatus Entotheonella sp.]
MELPFFQLAHHPFSTAPTADQLFRSRGQQRVLQDIIYGIESRRGVTAVLGARGMGKTTLIRTYIERRAQKDIQALMISGWQCSFETIVEQVCQLCDVPFIASDTDSTLHQLRAALTREYETGPRIVIIIDEAESIPLPVLESILVLADMTVATGSLLQIILLADPAFERRLKHANSPWLNQRIEVRLTILPLTPRESLAYIQHRIASAALSAEPLFTRAALRRIVRYAKGNPGLLNYVCNESMGRALRKQQKPIDATIVQAALSGLHRQDQSELLWRWGAIGAASVLLVLGLYFGASTFGDFWLRVQTAAVADKPVSSTTLDPRSADRMPHSLTPSLPDLNGSRAGDSGISVPDTPVADPAEARQPEARQGQPTRERGMSKAMARAAGVSWRQAKSSSEAPTPSTPRALSGAPSDPIQPNGATPPPQEAAPGPETSPASVETPDAIPPEAVTSVVCLTPRSVGNRRRDVILVDAAGKVRRRLVSDGALNLAPLLSPDGQVLAYTSYREGGPSIYLRHLMSARDERLTLREGFALPGSWAPNGRYLVLSKSENGNSDIFLYDRDRRHLRRLTTHDSIDISPSFAPDSARLVFTSNRSGSSQIYLTDVHGREPVRLTSTGDYNTSAVWSPRGDTLAFVGRSADQSIDIYTMRADGTERQRVTQSGSVIEESPSWAPDGQSIMYTQVHNGTRERRIVRVDGTEDRELPGHSSICYSPQWVDLRMN